MTTTYHVTFGPYTAVFVMNNMFLCCCFIFCELFWHNYFRSRISDSDLCLGASYASRDVDTTNLPYTQYPQGEPEVLTAKSREMARYRILLRRDARSRSDYNLSMARVRKLFPIYGSALANNMFSALSRGRLVDHFVAAYVAEYRS